MLHPQAEIYVNEKLADLRTSRLDRPYNRKFPSLSHAIASWRRAQPPQGPTATPRLSRPARAVRQVH